MLSALLWFDVGYCEFSDFSHEIEPLSENIVVGLYLPKHHTVRKNEHWRAQEKKVRSSIEAVQSNIKKKCGLSIFGLYLSTVKRLFTFMYVTEM